MGAEAILEAATPRTDVIERFLVGRCARAYTLTCCLCSLPAAEKTWHEEVVKQPPQSRRRPGQNSSIAPKKDLACGSAAGHRAAGLVLVPDMAHL